jgi:hypothetical protein
MTKAEKTHRYKRKQRRELSPRNVKSLKLLEKNGFTIKTEFNNGYPDSVIYALENTGREKDT